MLCYFIQIRNMIVFRGHDNKVHGYIASYLYNNFNNNSKMFNMLLCAMLQDENVQQEYGKPTYTNVTLRSNRQYLRG